MRHTFEEPLKLSVFVGSPKKELEDVRLAIIHAILEAGHIPDGMELWASDARPTLKTISEKLLLCDLHLVLLGSHYGQLLENDSISFTEWEYRQSRDANRPVISFLLEQDAFEAHWRAHPPSDESRRAYLRFWNELRSRSVCRLYSSLSPRMLPSIGRDVQNAVNQVIDAGQLRDRAGWIRAESKAASLTAAIQGNPLLLRVMDRVVRFKATGSRFEKERRAKKAAAEMFWDTMMNQLARAGYMDLFLESGSSLTYVSEALESKLTRQPGWRIATNNALSLLQLLLFTDGEIRRNPPVAPDPDDPYGAIFTAACKRAYEEPPLVPRALYKLEKDAIEEIITLLTARGEKQIVLATASGWDTAHPIQEFRGPHVGSHANMLFKRSIFMAGQPVVLFLSRHKVDPRFREAAFKCRTDAEKPELALKYCYPVFGEELPLARALQDTPLAICIGYEVEKDEHVKDIRHIGEELKRVLRSELAKANFDLEYAAKEFILEDGSQAGAIMVANEKFRTLFPR